MMKFKEQIEHLTNGHFTVKSLDHHLGILGDTNTYGETLFILSKITESSVQNIDKAVQLLYTYKEYRQKQQK